MSTLTEMIGELRALIEAEPEDREGLDVWYEAAARFQKKYPLRAESLPHVVEHYLADADIRVRDADYRNMQLAEVRNALEALRA